MPLRKGRLPPHPPPPTNLPLRRLPLHESAGPWYRIARAEFSPLYFGRTVSNRFDDPWRRFGVLYAAERPAGAIVEVFGYLVREQIISLSELRRRRLARMESHRPLRLVDLTGPGLARLGGDARLCSGDHGPSRRWSAALHRHPEEPDGIRFLARHDPHQECVALFDRCEDAITWDDEGSLGDPPVDSIVGPIFDAYGYGVHDGGEGAEGG